MPLTILSEYEYKCFVEGQPVVAFPNIKGKGYKTINVAKDEIIQEINGHYIIEKHY